MGLIENYFQLLFASVLNFRLSMVILIRNVLIFSIYVLLCAYPLFLERLIAACDIDTQMSPKS